MKNNWFASNVILFVALLATQAGRADIACHKAQTSIVAQVSIYNKAPGILAVEERKLEKSVAKNKAEAIQLLAQISEKLPLETTLVSAIENAIIAPSPSTHEKLERTFERSAQFGFLSSHGQAYHRLMSSRPTSTLRQEIKAKLYAILFANERVLNTDLMVDIEEVNILLGKTSTLQLRKETLKGLQKEMPEIQTLADVRRELFVLPAKIRNQVPVTDANLEILSKFSQHVENSEIRIIEIPSSKQLELIGDLRAFLQKTAPFSNFPPEFREAMVQDLPKMKTPEAAAVSMATIVTQMEVASPELRSLVLRYLALQDVQTLVEGASSIPTSSSSNSKTLH